MNSIVIDRNLCKKDGLCIAACPFALFRAGADGVPLLREKAAELCIGCGHCLAICPGRAITLNGVCADDCTPVRSGLNITPEQAAQLFRSRRSIRGFTQTGVKRGDVAALVDLARWAPSAKNGQPVHWLALTDAGGVRRLAGLVADWMEQSDLLPAVVEAYRSGRDMILRDAPCLLIAHARQDSLSHVADCTIALATVEAAAPVFGLGGCWAGFFMGAARSHAPLRAALALPAGHAVFGALLLGYPKYAYQRIPPRAEARITWR